MKANEKEIIDAINYLLSIRQTGEKVIMAGGKAYRVNMNYNPPKVEEV